MTTGKAAYVAGLAAMMACFCGNETPNPPHDAGGSGPGGVTASGGLTATGGAPASGGVSAGGTGGGSGSGVCPADSATYLSPVNLAPYRVDSPLWKPRLKRLITTWIPYVYGQFGDPNLVAGGLGNFVEAGHKIAGQPSGAHVGKVFADSFVYNAVEAMSAALMLDPGDDQEIADAQASMRTVLSDWIPKIVSAQESDGYLQTYITLSNTARWTDNTLHEGYVAGYFLEAAMVHYLMTNGTDSRLYDAAKRLADCWVNNLGPAPKRLWWDGHQGMEQALTRLARFVTEQEGAGAGNSYAALAKFLLDSRGSGAEPTGTYDQSQTRPLNQTSAVGHAVRATYLYSAMADVAMTTGSSNYLSAADTLWNSLVNRKLYVNACIGAGDARSDPEGFGPDYYLPNVSYCESCSSCGMLFFQHKMMLAHKDGRYANLGEMTLYNTILGAIDLAGSNFEYTNPLDQTAARTAWHSCPCCVGNVPRILLELPTWTYAKGDASLYINLFVGGTADVGSLAGTSVQVAQTTDYPWSGDVSITLNPATAASFAVRIRVPDRSVSTLYSSSPAANGVTSVSVNGAAVSPTITNGYLTICRTWAPGDEIELVLPLAVQRVKAVSQVAADIGRVALQYGPLTYNIENVDYGVDVDTLVLSPSAALSAEWNGSLLDGVTTIKGSFADGTSMIAIPHYARMNRGGNRSIVWIRDQ